MVKRCLNKAHFWIGQMLREEHSSIIGQAVFCYLSDGWYPCKPIDHCQSLKKCLRQLSELAASDSDENCLKYFQRKSLSSTTYGQTSTTWARFLRERPKPKCELRKQKKKHFYGGDDGDDIGDEIR